MFSIKKIEFLSDPCITQTVDPTYILDPQAVDFFDKDGYELTRLEQQYYIQQGLPVSRYTADHLGVFQPWISVEHEHLSIDHSCAMYRCNFQENAREQILKYRTYNPRLGWLLTSKQKWGLDLDIDYCDEDIALEVVHLEWDSDNLVLIEEQRYDAEKLVLNTDWIDAAHQIWRQREKWQNLTGWYAQAHWKAKYFGLVRPWY